MTPRRPGDPWPSETGKKLQHLMHVDDNPVGVTRSGPDEDVLHQPAIFVMAGLESRNGAEIDQIRIDRLAALEFLQQIQRPEPDALVFDINDGAVVGLEGVFRLQLDQFVRPDDLEIGTERTDLAVDVRSAHLAAHDWNDAADAMTGLARGDDLGDPRGN